MRKSIEAVLREYSIRLMALEGVVAVAEGLSGRRPCIRVLVARKTEDLLQKIPPDIEGYPVLVDESGEVRALG
ncbi:MAG: hypothetical protein HYX84_02890 [Chloroflexi bacterium]|nr:hypothetical protein [Chloroflexota bacterium]